LRAVVVIVRLRVGDIIVSTCHFIAIVIAAARRSTLVSVVITRNSHAHCSQFGRARARVGCQFAGVCD